MKTKCTHNRLAAVFLALAMLLTSITFSSFARAEEAATDGVYVLNASDLPLVKDKGGTFTDGQDPVAAGTDNYFKIHVDSNTRFDGSNQSFDDGFSGTQRINFNGGTNTSSFVNSVEFNVANPATVKIWWRSGDIGRYVALFDQSGSEIAKTEPATEKNTVSHIDTFDISDAGKYYIGNVAKSNYIFKIEIAEHAPENYVLNASDLPLVKDKGGTFTDGQDPVAAGTDNYFKIHVDSNTRFDGSNQSFDDGFSGTQRINFNGGTNTSSFVNSVEFTASGSGTVKVWWRSGDIGRYVALFDQSGSEIAKTEPATEKNTVSHIDTFDIPAAGKYYIGNVAKSNYIFKIEITVGGGEIVRGDWSSVNAPTITSAVQDGGDIKVTVSADVSTDGGDAVKVIMYDSTGAEVGTSRSSRLADTHELSFTPTASGKYSFKAVLSRDKEETTKESASFDDVEYVLPLGTPVISSATSMGGGKMTVVWSEVPEADSYNVYCDGTKVGTSKTTAFTVNDLTVGTKYAFTVSAVRGVEEGEKSAEVSATATAEEQRVWSHVYYGPSTNSANNGAKGNLNEDGKVTVYSEGGKGKIVPGGSDGLSVYYTSIPNTLNFTFRAKAHVDNMKFSGAQEGFGLIALDSVPEAGKENHWTNQYMLAISKIEYRWDSEKNKVTKDAAIGNKYTMKLGVGASNNKTGITPENLKDVEASVTDVLNAVAPNKTYQDPLEFSAVGRDAGTYNIVGGISNNPDGMAGITTISEITDFVIEIQRNNTGYFLTYYKEDGKTVIGRQKYYEPDALSALDKDNVYVGFFAARNARATFSDVVLTTIAPEDDAPAEERPVEKITPTLSVMSSNVSNSENYTLSLKSNVDGTVKITTPDGSVVSGDMIGDTLFNKEVKLSAGSNSLTITFTPDPDQKLPEFTALENTDPITKELTVTYNTKFAGQNNLYVAPDGNSRGNGGPEYPLDIYTAVSVVQPGQTIVVMEGKYELTSAVRIERGMDGTASNPIRMIADPEATSRPVFNFSQMSEGIRLGGSYWYMKGFDVTNSANGLTGFRVCGNNNTLDQINAYNNGNTGIQISAFRDSSDPRELWPQNNLILNCTSYNNADGGYEDADGFAAKLTCGDGNVFDGCAAYNNADDGWDLYAKVSSGNIGTVVIRNCIAYRNGVLLDGTPAGNGNGFKLGGEDLSAGHQLINSIAFENEADGITSNSCPDVKVINCTSFNNKKGNLNLYTNNKSNTTNYKVEGFISCGGSGDSIKKNATDTSEIKEETNKVVTADAFKSTEFGVDPERNEDGTLKLGDFLKLKDASESGADFDKEDGSTPSVDVGTINPDKNLPDPEPDTPAPPTPSGSSTNPKPDDKKPVEFEDENNDTDIEVTAPADAFDKADEIKFNAVPVPEETKDGQFTFDLTFTDKDGNKVQPKVAVTVRIPVPTELKDKTIYVYHVEDDGKYTEISCKVEDGMVVFTASKFSKYIITSKKLSAAENDPGDSNSNSGDSGNNSNSGDSGSGEGTNPSTGVAMPVVGMAVVVIGAALTVFVTKRKRG